MSGGEGAAAAAAAMVALVVSALGSALTMRVGPVDPPGRRTLHARPTPTSGAAAMPGAVALGLLCYGLFGGALVGMDRVGLALAFAAAAGGVGALDDMNDIDARVKLALSVLLAGAFVALSGPVLRLPLGGDWAIPLAPVVGLVGGGLWIVTASNAVNFMDGADGLAPGALAISFGALAVAAFLHDAPAVGVAAACGAAACLGFLPFNLAGRLFQGDAGALFAAFFFAALCLAAAGADARGPVSLYFGPIALMPFLADVLLTLLARSRRRASLLSAHREHLYQRWLQGAGRSHAALAWRAGLGMAASGAVAVAASFTSEAGQVCALVLAAVVCVMAWVWIVRRLET